MYYIDDAGTGCIMGKPIATVMNEEGKNVFITSLADKGKMITNIKKFCEENIESGTDITICRGHIFHGLAKELCKNWTVTRAEIKDIYQDGAEDAFLQSLYEIGVSKSVKLNGKDYISFHRDLINEIFINPKLISHLKSYCFKDEYYVTKIHNAKRLYNEFPHLHKMLIE